MASALAEELLRRGETVVALENGFSSDAAALARLAAAGVTIIAGDVTEPADVERAFVRAAGPIETVYHFAAQASAHPEDRKSTRLNSSHSQISYAVFCLKK